MRCKKAEILLSAYLDNELSIKEEVKIQAHIEGCSSCREKLEELRSYSALASLLEMKKSPPSLIDKVMSAIAEKGIKNKSITLKQGSSKTVFRIVAAVAAILIGITLIPSNLIRTPVIKSEYYQTVQKGGKGPSRGADPFTEKTDKKEVSENKKLVLIESLSLKNNAVIKDIEYLEKTKRLSHIKIKIPSENYESFKIEYNSLQKENPLPGISLKKWNRNINIIIGFPLNTFIAGEYTGDGYSDLIIQSSGGNQNNKWFISKNDSFGQFQPSSPVKINIYKKFDPLKSKIVSGDFNGDSYDDIAAFDLERFNQGVVHIYQNKKGKIFKELKSISLEMPEVSLDKISFLSGDLDGDGNDDLIFHVKIEEEEGLWFYFPNEGNGVFGKGKSFITGHTGWSGIQKYIPFAADINGDGLCDTGIYGKGGNRDACWYISLNNGDGTFRMEENLIFGNSSRAFQGDYQAFWGDMNADGLTDLLVKYGFSEQYSNWYKLINLGNFKFTLGQDLRFGDKADFSAH